MSERPAAVHCSCMINNEIHFPFVTQSIMLQASVYNLLPPTAVLAVYATQESGNSQLMASFSLMFTWHKFVTDNSNYSWWSFSCNCSQAARDLGGDLGRQMHDQLQQVLEEGSVGKHLCDLLSGTMHCSAV